MSRGTNEKPLGSRKPYRFVSSQEFIPWTRNPEALGEEAGSAEGAEAVLGVRGKAVAGKQEPAVRKVQADSKSKVAQAMRELGGIATAQGLAAHMKDSPSSVSAKIASLARSGYVEKCGEVMVTVRRFNGDTKVKASVWRLK